MRQIDKIKDQVRRLLSEEDILTVVQLSSMSTPPVSSTAVAIALNQLFQEGEVIHRPGQGWTLTGGEGSDDAIEA